MRKKYKLKFMPNKNMNTVITTSKYTLPYAPMLAP